jgi:DNA repair protein RadC
MKEKPRERLARFGVEGLKNDELLALILKTGYKGKPVFDLAKELISKHAGLIDMTYKELSSMKGIGPTKAAVIVAAKELVMRHFQQSSIVPRITGPMEVIAQVNEIRDRQKENFVVIYLNARNELLRKEFVSIGTLNLSIVHPREVFGPAIEHHAMSLILTHNHPSGDPAPSANDKDITVKLVRAGDILGIEVVDHVIITKTGYYSFKEQNPALLCADADPGLLNDTK